MDDIKAKAGLVYWYYAIHNGVAFMFNMEEFANVKALKQLVNISNLPVGIRSAMVADIIKPFISTIIKELSVTPTNGTHKIKFFNHN